MTKVAERYVVWVADYKMVIPAMASPCIRKAATGTLTASQSGNPETMEFVRSWRVHSSGVRVGGKIAAVFPTWVLVAGWRRRAARVLPYLPPPVPMKTEFGQCSGDLTRLFVLELNPNPPANHFGQFPKLPVPQAFS
jgi:hypothetical protein